MSSYVQREELRPSSFTSIIYKTLSLKKYMISIWGERAMVFKDFLKHVIGKIHFLGEKNKNY